MASSSSTDHLHLQLSSSALFQTPTTPARSPSNSSPSQLRYYDTPSRSILSTPSSSSSSVAQPPYPNTMLTNTSTILNSSKSNGASPSSYSYSSASSLSLTNVGYENKNVSHTKHLQSQLDDLQRKIDEKSSTFRQHLSDQHQQHNNNRSSYQITSAATTPKYTLTSHSENDRYRANSATPVLHSTSEAYLHSSLNSETGHDFHRSQVHNSSITPSTNYFQTSLSRVQENGVSETYQERNALVCLTNELNSLRSKRKEKEHYLYSELARVSRKLRENVAESKAKYEIAMLREKRRETESLFERELHHLSLLWALDRQRQKAAAQEMNTRYYLESPNLMTPDGYGSSHDGYYSSEATGYTSGEENAANYEQRRKAFEEKQEPVAIKQTTEQSADLLQMKKKLKKALEELKEKDGQIESLKEELSNLNSQESIEKLRESMKEQEKAFQTEREEWELEKENLRLNYRKQIEKETKRLQDQAKQEREAIAQKLATETLLRETAEQEIKTERLQKEGMQQLLQEARTFSERTQKDEKNKTLDLQREVQEQTKKNSELHIEVEKLREETRSLQRQLSDARNELLQLSKRSSTTTLPQEPLVLPNGDADNKKRASVTVSSSASAPVVFSPPPPLSPTPILITPSLFVEQKSVETLTENGGETSASTEPRLYSPTKDDELDAMISASLQKSSVSPDDLPHNFTRISKGLYLFGTKRITILLRNGKAMVKTAGGSLMEVSDFVKKNGKAENAKIHKRHATPDKDCVVCIKRKVTPSKSS